MRLRRLAAGLLAVLLTCMVFASPALADGGTTTPAPDVSKLQDVLKLLQQTYKDGVDLNKAMDGAIKGALDTLGDPFTDYFPAADYKAFMDSLNGQVVGIGAYVDKVGDYIQISRPIAGSPAEQAGLLSGDLVLEINGVSLKGVSLELGTSQIRGPEGTTAHLKIRRPSDKNREFTVDIVRAVVRTVMVHTKMLNSTTGYLQLEQFSQDSPALVRQALDALKKQGAKGIVFDLRNNPGGYLDAAWSIGSLFVPAGKPVVRVDQPGQLEVQYNAGGGTLDLPVVTLVNENTASAAEIVSGAIQDYKVGPLVGTRTYGKGTVQQIYNLNDGSGIKITMAEYLTGGGHHVHKLGITPDYVVEAYRPDPERYTELQLTRSLHLRMVGLDVLALQQRLNDLGFKAGEEDAFFSTATWQALQAFQRDYGLPVTGFADKATAETINQATKQTAPVREAQKPDPQMDKALELIKALELADTFPHH